MIYSRCVLDCITDLSYISPRVVIPQLHIGIKDGMAVIYNHPPNIWPSGDSLRHFLPSHTGHFFIPRTRRYYCQPKYHSYSYPPPPYIYVRQPDEHGD